MDLSILFGWAFLVPLLPALAFVIIGVLGERLGRFEHGGWIAVLLSGAAMVLGVLIAIGEMLNPNTYTDVSYTWFHVGASGPFANGVSFVVGTLVDPISALMLIVVTVVGFLVMLYSVGYMHHDEGLPRYYALLSLFLTAMLGVVLSDNLLEFFLFWELVGVCSYFLIGFYWRKPSASSAAKEAFLVTRIGDVMFLLGIFIYFSVYAMTGPNGGWAANGFLFVHGSASFIPIGAPGNSTLLTVAGLMLLGGAAGKSAQFPLDVWLPDAMEGPTTVSALIHAATMVAAGVYLLVVGSIFLGGYTSIVLFAIVAVGGFTTFYAATMAVVNTDIKRVIAYSTISQLGYMVLAVGAGFAMVGLYQLFTHAFFKALLFLAAGAIIHTIVTQDLFRMGGLAKKMRYTSIAFLIGALALSGIPPFAGFWSKDDVLASVYSQLGTHPEYWPFFILAFVTVFLTAYYIFRVYFLAFSGERARDASLPEAHEVPWVMLVPMIVLAGFAVVAGLFAFVPSFAALFTGVPGLATNVPPAYGPTDLLLSAISVTLAGAGILLAWGLWGNGRVYELRASSPAHSIRNLLLARYHVKAAYDWVGMVGMYTVARAADFFDRFVIDGAVKGFERSFRSMSDGMRRIQTGLVSDYAAYVVAGVIAVFVLLLFVAPYLASLFGGG